MYWGTHACLPVLTVTTIDTLRVSRQQPRLITNKQLWLIALAALLPDILSPHFSIADRHSSWTHTLWFLGGILPVILILSKWLVKTNWQWLAFYCYLASCIHVFLDGIAGGVSFLYPMEGVFGDYYVPWKYWIYSDVGFILMTRLMLFILNRKVKQQRLD